jgi:magnesium transporter
MRRGLGENQLLWVDLDERDEAQLAQLGAALELPAPVLVDLHEEPQRAGLRRFTDIVRLTMVTLVDADGRLERRALDILAGRSLIVTLHAGPSHVVDDARDELSEETRVGALDASAMVAMLVDVGLGSYFRELESIEVTIDRLDERALRARGPAEGVLGEIVHVRHRIGLIRRALEPHREAFAPLARPDFELREELGRPWPGLIDRLERAIGAVESVRTFLVGSFDIYMGRAAQRSNDVMKVLTLLSAVLLPAIVLAGIFGMNFQLAIFENPANVRWIVGAMAALAVVILGIARLRSWL